jgi:hypothetical protein
MHPLKQGLYDPRYEHDSCGVGFVVDLKNRKMHSLIEQALEILRNLEHRGACGCESETGDGAGIVLQTPHAFLARECDRLKIRLPQPGGYGVGSVFLPTDAGDRKCVEMLFEQIVREEGQTVLGWRDVPVNPGPLGKGARELRELRRVPLLGPCEGGMEVAMFALLPLQPGWGGVDSPGVRVDPLGKVQEVGEVVFASLIFFVGRDQPLVPVLPEGFVEAVPDRAVFLDVGRHQRLVHQGQEEIEDFLAGERVAAADFFRRLEIEATGEDR